MLQRQAGYLAALADNDITDPIIIDSTLELHVCRNKTRELLQKSPDITAIFACIDLVAVEILSVINEMGFAVPDDISIVGFDDIDMSGKSMPPLTTMSVDRGLMGKMAVRRLYERAANLDSVPITITIGTRLLQRQSTMSPSSIRAKGQ